MDSVRTLRHQPAVFGSRRCLDTRSDYIVDVLSTIDHREDFQKFVLLNSSGSLEFFVPTVTSIACKIKIHDFPFDVQTCTIKVMAQTFIARQYAIEAKFFTTNASRIAQMVLIGFLHIVFLDYRLVHPEEPGTWLNFGLFSMFKNNVERLGGIKIEARCRLISFCLGKRRMANHKCFCVDKTRREHRWASCGINYFDVSMKRNPVFYVTVVISPSFIINVPSCIIWAISASGPHGKDLLWNTQI
ncbi:hypothetical protein OSTOST_21562, partial [Ostertagia ostertagi]